MQSWKLSLLVVVVAVWAGACSHRVPIVSQPPVSVPATASAPAPGPSARADANRIQTQQRPTQTAAESRSPSKSEMTAQDRATLNDRLTHLEDALFDYDQTTIRADAMTALREDVSVIRGILENYPNQRLLIEGHADERGSAEYNLALGVRRARVAHEFLATMGVSKAQLSIITYGEERPVCTDQTESCWQRNRRAHIAAMP